MGNLQSISNKNDSRRSNRLSKPLTKKLPPSRSDYESPELSTGLIGWQNPWVGSSISEVKSAPSPHPREVGPLFELEPTPGRLEIPVISNLSRDPLPPRSSSLSAAPVGKRASQPLMSPTSSFSIVSEQPRRANSVQIGLQRQRSVYENAIEDATSSNTHFLVGNQRFSLTRRRSLLTRPGVATRRTTGVIRRMPSPIGEPEMDDSESTLLDWSLPPRQRPPSPADARYTQLGALKLGSLRVVNGSASPCPSERVPLARSTIGGPGLGLEAIQTTCAATLEPCSVSGMKKSDDVPGSPFSFEKSPTIAVPPRGAAILRELEDEGIAMCEETPLEKCPTEVGMDRSTSRSLNKSDSGYSSATSFRSGQGSRTRTSLDSQTSVSCAADEKIQLHPTLQGRVPGSFCQPSHTSDRWYDTNGVNVQLRPGTRARRSTLCAPRYTEYSTQKDLTEFSSSPYPFAFQKEEIVSSGGSSCADRYSVTTIGTCYSSSSSITLETASSSQQRTSTEIVSGMYRSASEQRLNLNGNGNEKHKTEVSHSRSRSRRSGRVWHQRLDIDVPPLPTILSPDHIQVGEENAREFPISEPRGRPRNRSQGHRRLTKTRQRPDVHMTTSPFFLG
ncbi:hypothetical protein N7520_007247 [Penicillium odoratum]|uniref:uncharacterized protein n=1 Tax=Penicillium odoratum TaxID=1167516 RepID=UPI0025471959|nr:uncharacterized protein N7520_007247 [Penicillium odoratum]KAJ5760091.1 hypothetical protein N7520_007247 [Penicillium odoratum]